MFSHYVCQSLSQIGHRIIQGDKPHGQLRLFGLFLLVFRCSHLGTPLVFLILIHLIDSLHLAHPGIHQRVDRPLAAGWVSGDIGNEVEPLLLAMNIEHHACRQSPDTRTDGCYHRHRQRLSSSFDGVSHAQRHPRQSRQFRLLIQFDELSRFLRPRLLCLRIDLAQGGVHKALVGIIFLVEIVDELGAIFGLRIVRQTLGDNGSELFTAHQLGDTD